MWHETNKIIHPCYQRIQTRTFTLYISICEIAIISLQVVSPFYKNYISLILVITMWHYPTEILSITKKGYGYGNSTT